MKTILTIKAALAVAALALAAPALASDATRDRGDAARPTAKITAAQAQRDDAVAPCGCTHCGMRGGHGRTHEVRSGDASEPSSAPTAGMRSGRR